MKTSNRPESISLPYPLAIKLFMLSEELWANGITSPLLEKLHQVLDHLIPACSADITQMERGEGYSGYAIDDEQIGWDELTALANHEKFINPVQPSSTYVFSIGSDKINRQTTRKQGDICETMPE